MLARAEVGETPADDGVVEPGMKVKVRLLGVDLEQEFLFGAREMAGDDVTVYSPQSPIGQAINGTSVGDVVSYELPNGKTQEAEILSAVPYEG
jgi:transcription elongation factor GreA